MNPAAADELRPWVVIETLVSGVARERYFDTRHHAEVWIWMLPMHQAQGELLEVRAARLRPSALGVN